MPYDKKDLKKLPGRIFSFFGVKRLWQGPDHLLWVEAFLWQEQYKRFYYKDIQAILLQRSEQHHIWTAVWGVLTLITGVIALALPGTPYVSGPLTVIFVLCLLVNVLLGPACTVYLQTAVQLQKITLGRLRKATDVVDQLKEIIENAQGRLDATIRPAAPAPLGQPPGALHAIRPENGSMKAPAPVTAFDPLNPTFHILLFSVLVAAGINRVLQYATGWLTLGFLDLLFIAAGLCLAVVALARSRRQIKSRWLVHSTWTGMIFLVLHGLTCYFYYIITTVRNPDLTMHHWELLKKFVEALMGSHPATMGIQLGSAAISIILGVSGFLALRKK